MTNAPTFNHTRADGPFDPCPECLEKMSREQLLALAKDQRETIARLGERIEERCEGDLACEIVKNGGPYQITDECVHISRRELEELQAQLTSNECAASEHRD